MTLKTNGTVRDHSLCDSFVHVHNAEQHDLRDSQPKATLEHPKINQYCFHNYQQNRTFLVIYRMNFFFQLIQRVITFLLS